MNQLKFTKTRIIFLLGLVLTASSILYLFKSSDKLQALSLVILGLAVTFSSLIYVLVKNLKQYSQTNINNDSSNNLSEVFAGLIEGLAYMFFM